MSLTIRCQCGRFNSVDAGLAGQRVLCTSCGDAMDLTNPVGRTRWDEFNLGPDPVAEPVEDHSLEQRKRNIASDHLADAFVSRIVRRRTMRGWSNQLVIWGAALLLFSVAALVLVLAIAHYALTSAATGLLGFCCALGAALLVMGVSQRAHLQEE